MKHQEYVRKMLDGRKAELVIEVAKLIQQARVFDTPFAVPPPVEAPVLQEGPEKDCCGNCRLLDNEDRCGKSKIGTKHKPKRRRTDWCIEHVRRK